MGELRGERLEVLRKRDEAGEISRQRVLAQLWEEVGVLLKENEELRARNMQLLALLGRSG